MEMEKKYEFKVVAETKPGEQQDEVAPEKILLRKFYCALCVARYAFIQNCDVITRT